MTQITFRNHVPCSSRLSMRTSLDVRGDDHATLMAHAFEALWLMLDWTKWNEFEVEGQKFRVRIRDIDDFDDEETCMDVEAA